MDNSKEGILEQELIKRYSITAEQLNLAHKQNVKNRSGLLANLLSSSVITEAQMVEVQVHVFGARHVQLRNYPVRSDVVALIAEGVRSKNQLLPLSLSGNILSVATSSILQAQAVVEEIQKTCKHILTFVLATPTEIRARLQEFTSQNKDMDDILEQRAKELTNIPDLSNEKLIEDPHGPIAQVINHLVNLAVTSGASDMHFEPMQSLYRVRFRQDGVLHEIKTFDKVFTAPFAAAIKIMANMDIAETRMPLDGTFRQVIGGRIVDFRVASYPTENGEKIVVRILDSNKGGISIDNLLLPASEKEKLTKMVENPYGLIVCAGPTGSGKSTTLYAILNHLNSPDINILTIEDPIEYRMAGISQAQVNVKKGFTFASGLRAMLRLDPNVILVGEMRDLETASIGVQAALTGHLVLSTIHANSAAQTVARFLDMGVEPFTVASALQGVISQRLARRICDQCKEVYTPTEQELIDVGFHEPLPKTLHRGRGCRTCRNEGYKGRLPIMEILVVIDQMRPLIQTNASPKAIFDCALKFGHQTIRDNALVRIRDGLTTPIEVVRVLGIASLEEKALKKAA